MIPVPPAAAAFIARQGVQTAWRIARIAVPILVILGLVIAAYVLREQRDHARDQRDALQGWQNGVVVAITTETVPADRNGRRANVDPATVVTRIHGLGEDVRNLRAAVRRQNVAITAAHDAGEQRLQEAQRGAQEAVRRNAPREATRRAIQAPGRTTGISQAEWSQL